jgi:hypothetical protein
MAGARPGGCVAICGPTRLGPASLLLAGAPTRLTPPPRCLTHRGPFRNPLPKTPVGPGAARHGAQLCGWHGAADGGSRHIQWRQLAGAAAPVSVVAISYKERPGQRNENTIGRAGGACLLLHLHVIWVTVAYALWVNRFSFPTKPPEGRHRRSRATLAAALSQEGNGKAAARCGPGPQLSWAEALVRCPGRRPALALQSLFCPLQ